MRTTLYLWQLFSITLAGVFNDHQKQTIVYFIA